MDNQRICNNTVLSRVNMWILSAVMLFLLVALPAEFLSHSLKTKPSMVLDPQFWVFSVAFLGSEIFGFWATSQAFRSFLHEHKSAHLAAFALTLCCSVGVGVSPWSEEAVVVLFVAPSILVPLAFIIGTLDWL